MHWGVRKAEDGGSNKQARRERKAQKFDVRAEMFQTKINELNLKQPRFAFQARKIKKETAELSKEKQRAEEDAAAKRQGKLSHAQKKVLVGAAVAATIVTAYATVSHLQSGELQSTIAKGKGFITGKGSNFTKNAALADKNMNPDEIMAKVVKGVNPEYGGLGTKMNCRRCTYAYEMRRRGLDVTATRTTNGSGQNVAGVYNALNPNSGVKPVSTRKTGIIGRILKEQIALKKNENMLEVAPLSTAMKQNANAWGKLAVEPHPNGIFRAIAGQPDGARGEFGMGWSRGGGHSMAWEMVKGKPVIFDTQSGKKFESAAGFAAFLDDKKLLIKEAGITRLDDMPLNDNFLMRWVRNAS